MTVAELITLLQGCDQTQRVIVNGYEGGFHDVKTVNTTHIALNVNVEWYYGPHDSGDSHRITGNETIEAAVHIGY